MTSKPIARSAREAQNRLALTRGDHHESGLDRPATAHGNQDTPVAPALLAKSKWHELMILRTDPFPERLCAGGAANLGRDGAKKVLTGEEGLSRARFEAGGANPEPLSRVNRASGQASTLIVNSFTGLEASKSWPSVSGWGRRYDRGWWSVASLSLGIPFSPSSRSTRSQPGRSPGGLSYRP